MGLFNKRKDSFNPNEAKIFEPELQSFTEVLEEIVKSSNNKYKKVEVIFSVNGKDENVTLYLDDNNIKFVSSENYTPDYDTRLLWLNVDEKIKERIINIINKNIPVKSLYDVPRTLANYSDFIKSVVHNDSIRVLHNYYNKEIKKFTIFNPDKETQQAIHWYKSIYRINEIIQELESYDKAISDKILSLGLSEDLLDIVYLLDDNYVPLNDIERFCYAGAEGNANIGFIIENGYGFTEYQILDTLSHLQNKEIISISEETQQKSEEIPFIEVAKEKIPSIEVEKEDIVIGDNNISILQNNIDIESLPEFSSFSNKPDYDIFDSNLNTSIVKVSDVNEENNNANIYTEFLTNNDIQKLKEDNTSVNSAFDILDSNLSNYNTTESLEYFDTNIVHNENDKKNMEQLITENVYLESQVKSLNEKINILKNSYMSNVKIENVEKSEELFYQLESLEGERFDINHSRKLVLQSILELLQNVDIEIVKNIREDLEVYLNNIDNVIDVAFENTDYIFSHGKRYKVNHDYLYKNIMEKYIEEE